MAYTMDFDYDETYTLMRKFRELTKQEVRIMDYLMKMSVFEGRIATLPKLLAMKRYAAMYVKRCCICKVWVL